MPKRRCTTPFGRISHSTLLSTAPNDLARRPTSPSPSDSKSPQKKKRHGRCVQRGGRCRKTRAHIYNVVSNIKKKGKEVTKCLRLITSIEHFFHHPSHFRDLPHVYQGPRPCLWKGFCWLTAERSLHSCHRKRWRTEAAVKKMGPQKCRDQDEEIGVRNEVLKDVPKGESTSIMSEASWK